MTLSGGASSGSSHGTRSLGSEGDMVHRMELMRKRRMESNRESAKRSRQRKQQHLDDLNSQVNLTQSKSQMKKTRLVLQDMLKQANSDNARCPLISQGPPPN
uniref:Light-inducible protein CPRF-2 n=2 Tax=Zea mays TaxID=4577 RepID=B6SVI4_MAIZE|nr:light-inducible protein CPRF-2 [Zea mays]|eukprot:NP_001147840.1 light-inducible protein CPRF-2 [Zea mays]